MALTDKLTAIADAIREKTGKADEMTLDQMAVEIEGIQTGGGDDLLFSILDKSITELKTDKITTIGSYLFIDCRALKEIDLPNLVSAERNAFQRCYALTEVELPSVTTLGPFAFQECTGLQRVSFPSLAPISNAYEGFFVSCTNLSSVNLPSMEILTSSVFRACTALKKVYLPKAREINSSAFQSSGIEELALPLTSAVCTLKNISAFTATVFASGGSGGTVYVPEALIESYKTATNWSTLYAAGTCNFVAIEGSEYE